ncbi:MAG: hypothetical protein JWN00_2851 [Actinomycetia bacterium]|nr:hypothetical protein [Actinomycetes bacterium]
MKARRVLAALTALYGLSACSAGASSEMAGVPRSYTEQRLTWAPCRNLPQGTPLAHFQCATMKVPLDYAEPDGDTIGIALIRQRASDPAHRIGSLIFNFGGPGGSGVQGLAANPGSYTELNTRYDLVGFDPRGVGQSAPVDCLTDTQTDAQAKTVDPSPDDAAELAAFKAADAQTLAGCSARSGKVIPYVGTPNTSRDMDVLRAVLGDARLHYFGISYGTWLGGNYAHLFPSHVGRIVLDGAVDPKISFEDLSLQQAAAFQRALGNFAASCAAQPVASCPLGRSGHAIVAGVASLLQSLDRHPLPTRGGRRLTRSLGESGVLMPLYSETYWPYLEEGLEQAEHGDGTILLLLADAQSGRGADGHYDNLGSANTAIRCADTTERHTYEQAQAAVPRFRKASPIFGPSQAWGLTQCTGWPYRGDNAGQEVSAPGTAPIVVIGNTGDPATPYAWAPALAKELGNGVLVTLHGQGHGAYVTGDPCIQSTVNSYLLDGTVPAPHTTCR